MANKKNKKKINIKGRSPTKASLPEGEIYSDERLMEFAKGEAELGSYLKYKNLRE